MGQFNPTNHFNRSSSSWSFSWIQNTFIHSYIYHCLRFLNKSQLQVQFWCKSSRNCFVLFVFCFSFSPLEVVWSREKSSAFCFHFQFSVRPIIQKLAWLCYLYSIFIFNKKKVSLNKKNEYTFLWYSFLLKMNTMTFL